MHACIYVCMCVYVCTQQLITEQPHRTDTTHTRIQLPNRHRLTQPLSTASLCELLAQNPTHPLVKFPRPRQQRPPC